MDLEFPPLSGGTVSGLNDAGIETFEGEFAKNVVRECAQNSLDAAADKDKPVTLEISRMNLRREDLPFISALEDAFRASRDHWHQHDKAQKFFTAGIALARKPQIDALKISDTGTTGVDGEDEEITGR